MKLKKIPAGILPTLDTQYSPEELTDILQNNHTVLNQCSPQPHCDYKLIIDFSSLGRL